MAYNKQTWFNEPTYTTPISAARLNHMEDGISDAALDAANAAAAVSGATSLSLSANSNATAANETANDALSAATAASNLTGALDTRLDVIEPIVSGHTTTINGHTSTINSHTSTITGHTNTLNTLGSRVTVIENNGGGGGGGGSSLLAGLPVTPNMTLAEINAVLNSSTNIGLPVLFQPGFYDFVNTLTIDLYKHSISAPAGGVILNFSSMPATIEVGVHIMRSIRPANREARTMASENITVYGPGKASSMTAFNALSVKQVGVLMQSDEPPANGYFVTWQVRNWHIGWEMSDNAYIYNMTNCSYSTCNIGFYTRPNGRNTAVFAPGVAYNSGENIKFFGCTWSGCDWPIWTENKNAELVIETGSFDYNTHVAYINASRVALRDCHYEFHLNNTEAPFRTMNYATLVIDGANFIGSNNFAFQRVPFEKGTTSAFNYATFPYIIDNQNDPNRGTLVKVLRAHINNQPYDYIAGGPGLTEVEDISYLSSGPAASASQMPLLDSASGNRFRDPDFSEATRQDLVWIYSGGTRTDRYNSANGVIAFPSVPTVAREGDNAMRITKTGAVGAPLIVDLVVPQDYSRQLIGGRVYMTRGSGATDGNVTFSLHSVALDPWTVESGVPVYLWSFIKGPVVTTDSGLWLQGSPTANWEELRSDQTAKKRTSKGATHTVMRIDLTAASPGVYYLSSPEL